MEFYDALIAQVEKELEKYDQVWSIENAIRVEMLQRELNILRKERRAYIVKDILE